MTARTVIFSDTHLGAPGRSARNADALRPLWAGATRLILNGDIGELSDPRWRRHAAREVLRIEDLCAQDGVELSLVSGNHDPLVTDQRHLRLCNGAVFVTHGDVLHPAISPWNPDAHEMLAMHRAALASLAPEERGQLEPRLAAVQHASSMKWEHFAMEHAAPKSSSIARLAALPPKAARVLWYWLTLPQRAAAFAAEHAPESRFFIFGHYHRTGVWRRGGRTIIDTGAFVGALPPAAVVIENGTVGVHRIRRDGDLFRLTPRALRVFDVTGRTIAPGGPSAAAA